MGMGGLLLRKLRSKVTDEPTGFAWVDDSRVAASGYPASKGQLRWLSSRGIDCVLTLTERPLPKSLTDGLSMEFRHAPMADHAPPTVQELELGSSLVQSQVNSGRKVLVHCLAGEGRTGCVLAAYLMRAKGLTPEEALATLRKVKGGFVEKRQETSLAAFSEHLKTLQE